MEPRLSRRSFLRVGKCAVGGLAVTAGFDRLPSKIAWAQQPSREAKPQNWLSLTDEPALEPTLPLIDPHHHLWDRPGDRYMLEDLVTDVKAHNVRQTVFVECSSMYRADGPEEFKVVGETEFVQGVGAMSASGRYGDTRVATGIVGSADLRLGDRIAPVLEAHIAASPRRFRGIRHRAAWADKSVAPNQNRPIHRNISCWIRRSGGDSATYASMDCRSRAGFITPTLPISPTSRAAFPTR